MNEFKIKWGIHRQLNESSPARPLPGALYKKNYETPRWRKSPEWFKLGTERYKKNQNQNPHPKKNSLAFEPEDRDLEFFAHFAPVFGYFILISTHPLSDVGKAPSLCEKLL